MPYKYVCLALLWISLYLTKLPALEFWMLVTKGGNACHLQRETCQSAQHNSRKIWGLFLCRFVSKATLTRQEARACTRTPGSPVIHFLRLINGILSINSPRRWICISITLTEPISSLHSPSCSLEMLVRCSLKERAVLVRKPWEKAEILGQESKVPPIM